MKNKKKLKNLVYLTILVIVLAASTINVKAGEVEDNSTCSGGEYLNRVEVVGLTCKCSGVTITQKTCEFQQFSRCNALTCSQLP